MAPKNIPDPADLGLVRAALRAEQAGGSLPFARRGPGAAAGMGAEAAEPAASDADRLAAALEIVRRREAAMVEDGPWLRAGVFKYRVDEERRRWARTRAIIRRTLPGPDEDLVYLALIAQQAASVELARIGGEAAGPAPAHDLSPNDDSFARVIVGTTPTPFNDGHSRRVGDGALVVLSAGMIDFMYQVNKAIVLAWKRVPAARGSGVGFRAGAATVTEVIDSDPRATTQLQHTLETWLFDGHPRAADSSLLPAEYHPPLSLLTSGAERFVVAHEYGHILFDQFGGRAATEGPGVGAGGSTEATTGAPADPEPLHPWTRELRADLFATIAVALSSSEYDLLPTNIALQGAVVAMKAQEVLLRALATTLGMPTMPDGATLTHPSFVLRRRQLETWYVENHPEPAAATADLGALRDLAETIELLWGRIEPRFVEYHQAGRQLAGIWQAPRSQGGRAWHARST